MTSRIKLLRERVGMTQLELAQYVGVTETTIANWENGRSSLEWIERVIRLCAALDCQPEELLYDLSPENIPQENCGS